MVYFIVYLLFTNKINKDKTTTYNHNKEKLINSHNNYFPFNKNKKNN